MRILYIAAGAAGSYCGACSHDTTLARGLHARGHDVEFIPLYTPVQSDFAPPGPCPVYYGGISAYLQQHSAIFRHTPEFFDRLFDSRWLLKLVERFAVSTQPEQLGEMTVSVLRGYDGFQSKELDRLVQHVVEGPRPDVLNITNTMLSVIAPAIRKKLGLATLCTMQGEESWIDRLGEPWRAEAVALIRSHAGSIDRLISPSTHYAEEMARFLDVERERIAVVRPGVDLSVFTPGERAADATFRVGYLSRIAEEKGTGKLVDAFVRMEKKHPGRATLALAGQARGHGVEVLERIRQTIDEAGLTGRFEFVDTPDLDGKLAFLRGLDVFVMPSLIPERRGTAVLEALACGVPVVVPPRGAFGEIIELAPGGVLVDTDDVDVLASTLERLRDDASQRAKLSAAALEGVRAHFRMERLVDDTLRLYEDLTAE